MSTLMISIIILVVIPVTVIWLINGKDIRRWWSNLACWEIGWGIGTLTALGIVLKMGSDVDILGALVIGGVLSFGGAEIGRLFET